jgi:hypothetical protein
MWQNRLYSRRLSEKNRAKASRWLAALLALGFALGAGARAFAYPPAVPPLPNPIADAPAATLLLPSFQVDLDNPRGETTIFTIINASPDPQIAHVVVWSDLSVHVIDFDVWLTGYGLYRLDLRSLLVNGVTPPTGPFGISHVGALSEPPAPGQAASCVGILPLPNVPAAQLLGVQQALTGQPSIDLVPTGFCGGLNHGDRIARGYVTIDDTAMCNVLTFPGYDGYFGSPDGRGRIVTDNNVLWGDEFHVNLRANKAYTQNLVHIKANPNTVAEGGFAPGDYTFYGRYAYSAYSSIATPAPGAHAWQAYDHREPLPTTFLSRYVNPNSPEGQLYFNSGTTEVVWRDSKVDQPPFVCPAVPGNPSWYGLGAEGIAVFDEQEDVITPPSCHFSPCPPVAIPGFPAETQQTAIGGIIFPTTPFDAGWMWLDLNHANPPGSRLGLNDPLEASSWVFYSFANTSPNALQSYRVAQRAVQLDTGNTPNHCTPNTPVGTICNDQ